MYHRVAAVRHDPWGLAVSPDRFDEQMAYLASHRRPMTMNELVRRLQTNALPDDAVAITFDDGYRDNLVNAKPILVKYEVPATFFLATGYVDGTSPFWWDELAAMVLQCERPARYAEQCAGEEVALCWGEATPADVAAEWRAAGGPRTERQSAYLAMWRSLQRATAAERDRVMRSLRVHFPTLADPLAIPMRTNEVQALLSADILTLGAHTVEHPPLTTLSPVEMRREIEESAQTCRRLSGRTTDGFAYPYGDLDGKTRETVQLAGLAWACSTKNTFLSAENVDLFTLPRVSVGDVPLERFKTLLTQ
jgi:peptidoglycan/xylan/chitin deacetylase (PgdA/CDA1 family)